MKERKLRSIWIQVRRLQNHAAPEKRAKKAALPGLSADSTTIPDHLEFRGRLVDGHGQLIMRSWMLGPIIQQQHNHQPTKLLIQYEHPCKQKSRCCECLAQFTKK